MIKLLIGTVVLILAGCAGVAPRQKMEQDLERVRQELARTPFLAEKWAFPLGERIERAWWVGTDLLVEASSPPGAPGSLLNLHCFNGKDGIISWTFGLSHALDSPPAGNRSFFYLLVEGELFLLRRESGALVSRVSLPFSPSSPAVAGDRHLWIGGWDKFLYTLDPENGKKEWRHLAKGDLTAPVFSGEGRVIFGAEDGCWQSLEADSGQTAWSEQLGGALRFAPVRDQDRLAVASDDMNVYLRHFPSGTPKAYFTLQSRPAAPPVLAGNQLLQATETRELQIFSLDQGPGPKARIPGCVGYLMTGKKFYYALGTGQEIIRIDPQTLQVVDTTRWHGLAPWNANPELGLLVAVSSAGTLLVAEER